MPKFLLMGDIHLSDKAPSSCTDTYLDDIFQILNETVVLAKQHDVDAVIWAGDVFHYKTPSRTSHATVRRLIDLARRYPCPVYVVPGNHDMQHDRFDSLDETQPLGVVIASGAVRLLQGWSAESMALYGVPWLSTFDDETVAAALASWREKTECQEENALVVTHAPLYPPGQELQYEHYVAEYWAEYMGRRGSVYYGHVHEPHGIYSVKGVMFCNPGAISRGSLHEHNLTRAVTAALWDSSTGQFTLLPVPHKPASEVFRLVEVGQAKTTQARLDDFLASIREATIEITSTEAVISHVRDQGLESELENIIRELLTEAS